MHGCACTFFEPSEQLFHCGTATLYSFPFLYTAYIATLKLEHFWRFKIGSVEKRKTVKSSSTTMKKLLGGLKKCARTSMPFLQKFKCMDVRAHFLSPPSNFFIVALLLSTVSPFSLHCLYCYNKVRTLLDIQYTVK